MLGKKAWLSVIHPKGDVRTLCRLVNFSHMCLYGPCFVRWCAVMLEQEVISPKLEYEMVQNALVS